MASCFFCKSVKFSYCKTYWRQSTDEIISAKIQFLKPFFVRNLTKTVCKVQRIEQIWDFTEKLWFLIMKITLLSFKVPAKYIHFNQSRKLKFLEPQKFSSPKISDNEVFIGIYFPVCFCCSAFSWYSIDRLNFWNRTTVLFPIYFSYKIKKVPRLSEGK